MICSNETSLSSVVSEKLLGRREPVVLRDRCRAAGSRRPGPRRRRASADSSGRRPSSDGMNAPARSRRRSRRRARSARSARSGTPAASRSPSLCRLAEMLLCIHGSHTSRKARGANSAMKSRFARQLSEQSAAHAAQIPLGQRNSRRAGRFSGLRSRAAGDLILQLAPADDEGRASPFRRGPAASRLRACGTATRRRCARAPRAARLVDR